MEDLIENILNGFSFAGGDNPLKDVVAKKLNGCHHLTAMILDPVRYSGAQVATGVAILLKDLSVLNPELESIIVVTRNPDQYQDFIHFTNMAISDPGKVLVVNFVPFESVIGRDESSQASVFGVKYQFSTRSETYYCMTTTKRRLLRQRDDTALVLPDGYIGIGAKLEDLSCDPDFRVGYIIKSMKSGCTPFILKLKS